MSRPCTCAFLSLAAVAVAAAAAAAQVGYLPSESPYQDFSYRQELTAYTGWFTGNSGSAGVGPGGGAVIGARYGLRLGGPVEVAAHLGRVFSDREVVAPTEIGAARNLGNVSVPLWFGDIDLVFNLTGTKSWHHLIPIFGFGGGLVSGGSKADAGGFDVGTNFAITFGTGVRYVPGGNWSARFELGDYMYQVQYPNSYFTAPAGGKSVLPATSGQNQWLHNGMITLGISYLYHKQ